MRAPKRLALRAARATGQPPRTCTRPLYDMHERSAVECARACTAGTQCQAARTCLKVSGIFVGSARATTAFLDATDRLQRLQGRLCATNDAMAAMWPTRARCQGVRQTRLDSKSRMIQGYGAHWHGRAVVVCCMLELRVVDMHTSESLFRMQLCSLELET